jgi:hypothetical protein
MTSPSHNSTQFWEQKSPGAGDAAPCWVHRPDVKQPFRGRPLLASTKNNYVRPFSAAAFLKTGVKLRSHGPGSTRPLHRRLAPTTSLRGYLRAWRRGAGPLCGHLRASGGRWTRWRELLLFLPFFLLTSQVSPQQRAASGVRSQSCRWDLQGTSRWRPRRPSDAAEQSNFSVLNAKMTIFLQMSPGRCL